MYPVALRALKELLSTASSIAGASQHRLDAEAAFGSEMVDGVLASSIRDFNWMQDSLNVAPERVKQTISLACFVHPERDSVSFRQRVIDGYTVASQEAVGEERTKMEKRIRRLYRRSSRYR